MVANETFEEPPAPKTLEELAVLVLDGSGSMGDMESDGGVTKASAVEQQLFRAKDDSLFAKLNNSTRRHEIWLAVVTFDHTVVKRLDPVPLSQVTPADVEVDLLGSHGGSTAIGRALKAASEIARQFIDQQQPSVPRFVTILLMSDGREEENTDPVGVATEIHKMAKPKQMAGRQVQRNDITVAAAAYGQDADLDTLRKVATQLPDQPERFFRRVRTGSELRDFFIQSMASRPIDQR